MPLLILLPVLMFGAIDNNEFLVRVTDAEWRYVGPTERQSGRQADGSMALTVAADGKSYILFKQRPMATEPTDIAETHN